MAEPVRRVGSGVTNSTSGCVTAKSREWRMKVQMTARPGLQAYLAASFSLALPRSSCILMLPRWDWRRRDRRWRRRGVEYQGHWQVTINHTSCQPALK